MNESESERDSKNLLLPPKAIDIQNLTPFDGVRIDPEQLSNFINHWRQSQWPEELLIKLLDNIRHIKASDFEVAIKEMVTAISAQQKQEYIFYSPEMKNKSGGFMFEKLNPYLVAAAKEPVSTLDWYYFYRKQHETSNLPASIEDKVRKGQIDFLYIDDATYSGKGGQVDVSLDGLIKLGVPKERVKIFVIASTEVSREQVKSKSNSF